MLHCRLYAACGQFSSKVQTAIAVPGFCCAYLSGAWFLSQRLIAAVTGALGVIGELASWFVNLPGRVARMSVAIATLRARGLLARTYTGIPTAITNMSPSNRFLQALESTPVVQGVTVHSIIAVQGDGKPEDGADGVVMYKSAHIDGVASEKVVRFSHSTQGHPETIQEIKRILLEHTDGVLSGREQFVLEPSGAVILGRRLVTATCKWINF